MVVDLLLDWDAVGLRERLRQHPAELAAPHLLDAEVGQVLRRFVSKRELSAKRAREALDDLIGLPLHRYAHVPLLERAFELRENVTFYDALYLALAEALDAELLTRDVALTKIRATKARVTVI